MILSANQPYFFPYITYYQMVHNSDCFISLDNFNYIKSGFINRNVLRDNNNRNIKFVIELKDSSCNKQINEIKILNDSKDKFLKKLKFIYGYKNNNDVYDLVNECFNSKYISEISTNSIRFVFKYLNLNKKIILSSEYFKDIQKIKKGFKIFEICKQTESKKYINLPGGKKIHNKNDFENIGVGIFFIQSKTQINYSILDLLFRKSKEDLIDILNDYYLE
jgi:hypothetical protein